MRKYVLATIYSKSKKKLSFHPLGYAISSSPYSCFIYQLKIVARKV